MENETTKQFWAGEFGDEYHRRQKVTHEANVALMRRILETTGKLVTVAELGAGTGLNLRALSAIDPDMWLCGVEINAAACQEILKIPRATAVQCAVQDWKPALKFDLVFTKGLAIHIPPGDLPGLYKTLVASSKRYIMMAEYFSVRTEEVPYRGHTSRLWKAPHAYQLMDAYPEWGLLDYGFVSSRDRKNPQDDLNWWVLQKGI